MRVVALSLRCISLNPGVVGLCSRWSHDPVSQNDTGIGGLVGSRRW